MDLHPGLGITRACFSLMVAVVEGVAETEVVGTGGFTSAGLGVPAGEHGEDKESACCNYQDGDERNRPGHERVLSRKEIASPRGFWRGWRITGQPIGRCHGRNCFGDGFWRGACRTGSRSTGFSTMGAGVFHLPGIPCKGFFKGIFYRLARSASLGIFSVDRSMSGSMDRISSSMGRALGVFTTTGAVGTCTATGFMHRQCRNLHGCRRGSTGLPGLVPVPAPAGFGYRGTAAITEDRFRRDPATAL